jgi:hypothetical protein
MAEFGRVAVKALVGAGTRCEMRLPSSIFILIMVLTIQAHAQSVNATYSFESGIEGWEVDSLMNQIPCPVPLYPWFYPECLARSLAMVDSLTAIRRTGEQAFDGTHSLKFTMDGLQGFGTSWIVRSFNAAAGVRYRVGLTFYVNPPGADANDWPKLAFAGAARPSSTDLLPGSAQRVLPPSGLTPFKLLAALCVSE